MSYLSHSICATLPKEIVHSDVWCSLVTSKNDLQNFVNFLDEYNHYTWLYFLKTKKIVYQNFEQFKAHIEL